MKYLLTGLCTGILLAAIRAGFFPFEKSPNGIQAASGTLSLSSASYTNGNVQVSRFLDNDNTSFYLDPNATDTAATVAGNLVIGQGKSIRTIFGPLNLDYKSGLNSWATALTVQDTTGYVGIGTTAPSTALDVSGTITATTFGTAFEAKTASCATLGCTATATCTSGKVLIFGVTANNDTLCTTQPNSCNGFCSIGGSSCAKTSTSGGKASVYAVCAKVN